MTRGLGGAETSPGLRSAAEEDPSTEPPLLFISYASEDSFHAAELKRSLTASGYRTWLAPDDIRGSRSWAEQILQAVTDADLLLVVVSGETMRSSHVGREVNLALDQAKPVLPIRIENCALSGTLQYLLALVQWVDAFPTPLHLHWEQLSHRIADLLNEPETTTTHHVQPQLRSPRHNLPRGLTPLFGREQDLRAVADSLDTHRCVTVVGAGGVGKTRFAWQVATDLVDRYPDGVWVTELTSLSRNGEVGPALVASLGLVGFDPRSDLERAIDYIGQQTVLVLFDNCEHVLRPVADAIQQLLRRCSRVRVLATSRERLHLAEELVYELSPLDLPAAGADADLLAEMPAVALLSLRAKEAGAGDPFLTNPEAVASVCRRVAGLPLALELAASRLRVMTISELDESLAGGLRLLATRNPGGSPHHATMAATVDWSRQLLDIDAQDLFSMVAVHQGGFDLTAASAVGGIESREEALELVSDLVESSLLVHAPADGVSRYRMLEPIRQHALSLLAQDRERESTARDSHAQHFLSLSLEAEPHMFGHGQAEWSGRLDRDVDNLRSALARLEDTNADHFLDMAAALANYWFNRGFFREGRSALEAALATPSRSDRRRMDALLGLAQLCWVTDQYERGEEAARTALGMAGAIGDLPASVIATEHLARLLLYSGKRDEASVLLEQVVTQSRDLGMHRWAGDATHFLGILAQAGDYQRARVLHRQARADFEAAGDDMAAAWTLGAEAVDTWLLGDFDVARELAAEASRRHALSGETRGSASGKTFEALFALDAGDLQASRTVAEDAVRTLRNLGVRRDMVGAVIVLSRIMSAMGDHRRGALLIGVAEAIFDRDLTEFRILRVPEIVATLERELADEFDATIDEGRELGWDGLSKLLPPK